MQQLSDKQQFLIRNIIRSVVWLTVFVVAYLIFRKTFAELSFIKILQPIFNNTGLMISIFLVSEIVVGIIPPELFVMWALRFEGLSGYLGMLSLLAVSSYLAGVLGYYIGRYLNTTRIYRYIRRRFLRKIEKHLTEFGIYLIVIAALTPLPFSGVSMLIGTVQFPIKRYLLFSLSRFLRFAIYAVVFWEANVVF